MPRFLATRLVKILDNLGWNIDSKFQRPHMRQGRSGYSLNHPHHVLLGPAVALDVALRRGKAAVAGKLLNIPQATAGLDDPLGSLGDERPAPAVG